MADDSNFDSWNEDQWDLYNTNELNLLFTRKSGKLQNFETNKINHLLDEIVCGQHSSQLKESEEISLRRINSAIYAESIKSDYDDSADLTIALSNISIDGDQGSLYNTYHREPLISKTTSTFLTSQSKSLTKVERRCRINVNPQFNLFSTREQAEIQRYAVNGRRVVHISTSMSSCARSNHYDNYNENAMIRNRAHYEWVQKKKLDIKRQKRMVKALEMRKKFEEEQSSREKVDRERKERDNFLRWLERKKEEDTRKRKAIDKEVEFEKRLREIETKIIPVKEFHLMQWHKKKEKILKGKKKDTDLINERKQEQENRMKRQEEEKKRRLDESSKAFKLWCEKSKNRPRPATQGLLPHQRATPSYINSIPWIVEDTLSSIQNDCSHVQTPNAILAKREEVT